jgi:LacI family transcriptional regulator, repressor for deo operon, udp, cdd, tsx, nupC, and nupG
MVSIKDVAKLAGVSIATVSRTINNKDRVNEETRERVRRAIEKTGFAPNALAQNFRRGRTNFIMVVLPSIGDPFFAGIVKGIQSIAQQKGYNVLFSETRMNSAEFTNMLVVSRQADGMILLATVPSAGVELLSRERHLALPVVIACEAIQPEMNHLPSVHIAAPHRSARPFSQRIDESANVLPNFRIVVVMRAGKSYAQPTHTHTAGAGKAHGAALSY